MAAAFICHAIGRARAADLLQAEKLLNNERLFDLMPEVARNHWKMSPILSLWAIQHNTPAQRETYEQSLQFARHLSATLDLLAPSLREEVSLESDDAVVRWLMALAAWLTTTPGSGNAILADRVLDLATIPLARLVVAPETPDAKLLEYERMLQPPWSDVTYRAQSLNAETGAPTFNVGGTDAEMKSVYERQAALAAIASMTTRGVEPRSEEVRRIQSDVSGAQDQKGFFDPEAFPAVATTTNRLGLKNTDAIVAGLGDGNARELLAVLKYRLRVGKLPTMPSSNRSRDVMTDEWEKHLSLAEMEDAALRTLGGRAGRAFERIYEGKLIDRDSFEARREAASMIQPITVPAHLQVKNLPDAALPSSWGSPNQTKSENKESSVSGKRSSANDTSGSTLWSLLLGVVIVATVGAVWLLLRKRR